MYMDYKHLLDGTANRELEVFLKEDKTLREYGKV